MAAWHPKKRIPALAAFLLASAIFAYLAIPTTVTGDALLGVRLGGQTVKWPSSSGGYSVSYGVTVKQLDGVKLRSVRLVPGNDNLYPKQVVLRVENQGVPLESNTLREVDGEYSLRDLQLRELRPDRAMTFEVTFDAAQASRISLDRWRPYTNMPHTGMELYLTLWGHPLKVQIPLCIGSPSLALISATRPASILRFELGR